MRAAVFAQKPDFARIVEAWGDQTLPAYYAQDFSDLTMPSGRILEAIYTETEKILGSTIADVTRESIRLSRWTNTADHHGLLFHPYFYTTALARSHATVRRESTATVTLPFGGVSLGNDSFPRGFYIHDREAVIRRFHFKSLSERQLPVYGRVPFTREAFDRECDRILRFPYTPKASERLRVLLDIFRNTPHIWRQETYSAQLTAMNATAWNVLFGTSRGDFVYLEIDTLARRLLLDHHLSEQTPINALLFDSAWRTEFLKLFSGVFGSHTEHSGAHFFWYLDEKQKKRRSLKLDHSFLKTHEGDVVIELTPAALRPYIERRTLMPTTALLLIMIHAVEGLACGGGSSQIGYLGDCVRAWQSLLARVGHVSAQIPTTSISCGEGMLRLPDMHTAGNTSLIDIYMQHENPGVYIDSILERMTMRESVDAIMPILYTLYISRKAKD